MGENDPHTGGLRILVSFKVTPDFEALHDEAWVVAADRPTGAAPAVVTRYVRRVLNCFDESALELALRLRDALADRGEAAGLGALSVGGRDTEPFFKTLLALGYEPATRVTAGAGEGDADLDVGGARPADGDDLDFAPSVNAALVAAFVRQVDHVDLLLTGCRSGPGDSGAVPFFVAEALGWPCLTQVTEVEPLACGRLRVTCTTDDGLLRATVRTPCVLAIGNAVVSRLRVPTLQSRLAVGGTAIRVVPAADLGVDVAAGARRASGAPTALAAIDRSRPGDVVPGETPREKAEALFEGYLRPRIAKTRAGGQQP